MRSFPRAACRRPAAARLAAALALGLMSALLTLPATSFSLAADDLKDRQKRVERKIDHANDDLHASSRRLSAANARLADARTQLAGARAQLATAQGQVAVAHERDVEMQAELDAAEAALAAAQAELVTGRQEVEDQQRSVASTISSIYQQGDPELLAFASILESETPADLTMRAEARNVVVGRETRAYDQLHAAEVLLEVRKDQVKAATDAVAVKRQEAADHLVAMKELEAEKRAARDSVRSLVGERSQARAAAGRARAADLRTLQALKRDAARIRERLQRIARRALARSSARAARSAPSGGFLDWPTAGPISSPFGMRKHPIYGYWGLHDGADFAPGCGAPIRAAASGRVISSYWSDVYGRRLIVNHGAVRGVGLATVYNHAVRYTVGVGASVSRGEVIGYVGNSGWSTGCHLHFTVMANGRPVSPGSWF